jgi:hypothetical protein
VRLRMLPYCLWGGALIPLIVEGPLQAVPTVLDKAFQGTHQDP